MRIENYTDELMDLAYETMTIKYYKEPEDNESFGKMMIQELVFYNDHMLLHVSDEQGEDDPVYPCSRFWYEDIETYEFDCDENVLTIMFLVRPDVKIYGNPTQLQKIYNVITTMDEKFIVTDFSETNAFFEEIVKNL